MESASEGPSCWSSLFQVARRAGDVSRGLEVDLCRWGVSELVREVVLPRSRESYVFACACACAYVHGGGSSLPREGEQVSASVDDGDVHGDTDLSCLGLARCRGRAGCVQRQVARGGRGRHVSPQACTNEYRRELCLLARSGFSWRINCAGREVGGSDVLVFRVEIGVLHILPISLRDDLRYLLISVSSPLLSRPPPGICHGAEQSAKSC